MKEYRPYQIKAIQGVKEKFKAGIKRLLMVMPTGAGKTFTFTGLVKDSVQAKPNRVKLVLVDRKELLKQAYQSFKISGINAGYITAEAKNYRNKSAVIAMVETYYNMISRGAGLKNVDFVIIDEAHKGAFKKVNQAHPGAYLLGVTATPLSAVIADPLNKYFDDVITCVDIPELVQNKWLSRPKYFAVPMEIKASLSSRNGDYKTGELFRDFDKPALYTGVVDNYEAHIKNKKTIIFCVNKAHTKNTKLAFDSRGYGSKTKTLLSGEDSAEARTSILKWFKNCPDGILINCGILTTGFDEPTIEAVILNRSTKRLTLYLQMIGRASRIIPGVKEAFIVIDMGNNIKEHKAWDFPRDWTHIFNNPPKKKKREKNLLEVADFKECQKCEAIMAMNAKKCPECGHEFSKEKKEIFALTEELCRKKYKFLFEKDPNHMTVDEVIIYAEMKRSGQGKRAKNNLIVKTLLGQEYSEKKLEIFRRKMGYNKFWLVKQKEIFSKYGFDKSKRLRRI